MKKNEKTKVNNARVYTRTIKGRKYLYADITLENGNVVDGIALSLPFDKHYKTTCLLTHGVAHEE